MGLREKMNENAALATIIALVLLLGGAFLLVRAMSGGSQTPHDDRKVYMLDLESGERYVGTAGDVPPATAPSGEGNCVRVHVFGCGSCDEAALVNGYLETLTPEGRGAAVAMAALTEVSDAAEAERLRGVVAKNTRVRTMDSQTWIDAASPAGQKIASEAGALACPDGNGMPCQPGQKGMPF